MSIPQISICIPAFEGPELIDRLFRSIWCQTFEDYEVIVTDDSRSDGVQKVVDRHRSQGHEIAYFKNTDSGPAPATNWNLAMSKARGQWIKIMHQDDWLTTPTSLEQWVRLTDPDADFCFCASQRRGPREEDLGVYRPTRRQLAILRRHHFVALFDNNWVGAPSVTLHRRSNPARFDPHLKWYIDTDFYLQILRSNPKLVYCADPLVSVSQDADWQLTRSAHTRATEVREALHVYGKLPKIEAQSYALFRRLWRLFSIHEISHASDLRDCGVREAISRPIEGTLLIRRLFLGVDRMAGVVRVCSVLLYPIWRFLLVAT